jgi:hypothetical protein
MTDAQFRLQQPSVTFLRCKAHELTCGLTSAGHRKYSIKMRNTMLSRMALAVLMLSAAPAWAQDKPASIQAIPAFSRNTPVEKIAADPAAAAVLNKDLPGLLSDGQYPFFKSMSLEQLQAASGGDLSQQDVNRTVADLQALARH